MRPGRRALVVFLALVGALAIAVGKAWAPGTTPTAGATFVLALDGNTVGSARDFELTGGPAAKAKGAEYRLRLTRGLTDDTSLVDAFQSGQQFATATVQVLDAEGSVLTTYTLSNAAVVSFEHTGSAASSVLLEEAVMTSGSLSVSG
jgi:hypothetical protein